MLPISPVSCLFFFLSSSFFSSSSSSHPSFINLIYLLFLLSLTFLPPPLKSCALDSHVVTLLCVSSCLANSLVLCSSSFCFAHSSRSCLLAACEARVKVSRYFLLVHVFILFFLHLSPVARAFSPSLLFDQPEPPFRLVCLWMSMWTCTCECLLLLLCSH